MKALTWLLVSLAVPASHAAAQSSCSSPLAIGNPSGVSSIRLSTNNYPNDDHIHAAVEHWNSGCEEEIGSAFPSIQVGSGCSTCAQVGVVFVDAPSTSSTGGCGEYESEPDPEDGGTIFIYRWNAFSEPCTGNDVSASGTLAHELGHALGLANSGCTSGIMGPPAPTGQIRDVLASDCGLVADIWRTPREVEQENCDLQCMVSCTGMPPSCPDEGNPGDPQCGDLCSCSACSPLIFDLDNDGIHTTSVDQDPVLFDLTGDSVLDRVGWTNPETEEGILYYDRNHNGKVDGARELFGDRTILRDGSRAANGFEALAAYDDPKNGGNGDGEISPADRFWGRIRMWVDRNHDAISNNDENYSLGQLHIAQINLAYDETAADEAYGVDSAGNWHRFKGTFVLRLPGNETVLRNVHDVYFNVKPVFEY